MLRKPLLLRSSKLAKRRRRALYRKLTLFVLAVAVLVGGVAYFLSRPQVNIQHVEVAGNIVVAEGDIRELVQEKLAGRYLLLFPRSNVFIVPRKEIKASLLSAFARLKESDVSVAGLQTMLVEVEEREPVALWCKRSTLIASGGGIDYATTSEPEAVDAQGAELCYFLDEDGFMFTEAPLFSGAVYFKFYGEPPAPEPVGEQFLPRKQFGPLMFFVRTLDELGVDAVSLSVTQDDEIELRLRSGGTIRFGRDQNLSEVFDNLESTLKSDVFADADLGTLDYIDMRFGDRVYYRFEE